jgi:hypothetical protein
MKIDFDYKLFRLENYLTDTEFTDLKYKIKNFDVNLSEIRSTLGFLSWSDRVKDKVKEIDLGRYNTIIENQYITFDDFQFLSNLNERYGFNNDDYFNFFLTYTNETFKSAGIYEIIKKCYLNILHDLFGKKVKVEYQDTLIGNINIYPKNSFIRTHQDNDPDGQRLFTILFFLNGDRTQEQGSLLKVYKQNETIDILPNYEYCIALEHQKYNLTHEVTKNLSDDVRYSIYSPFTIKDYEEKLIHT